ncbi:hypothetical protein [Haloferax sp. DFSO60]|uniref:hypothetical protein n=1 Tax=Haloferax sp. DFSO60 TaxID=3388652 RepID=UPI00397E5B37
MLDVPVPDAPTLPKVDPNQYDDANIAADADFKRTELEQFLHDGAWADAFEQWAKETPVTETQWQIVLDLDLLTYFDFFWDDFADRVGYHAPGIPEDWKERQLHPELTSWGQVSSVNAGLTELGQQACDVLKDDYIDWESEYEAPDDLPDFG